MAVERKKTILVVDDDPAFRGSIGAVLQQDGYHVLEAAGVQAALSLIDMLGDHIGLMIIDLCLPDGGSGLDVIRAARNRNIPAKIVAASAIYDGLQLEIALNFGADVAIRKPHQS